MEPGTAFQGQINVVVELGPVLMHFTELESDEGRAFKRYLLQQIQELVADLALAAEVSLTIRRNEDGSAFALSSYQVIVNDQKCRLPLPTIIPQDVIAIELARSLARVVCWNRELCVTTALAETVMQRWSSEIEGGVRYTTDQSLIEFQKFLVELVRRGFRIDRGKEVIRASQEKEGYAWQADRLFEDTIASWDTLDIKVFLSHAQHAMLLDGKEHVEAQQVDSDRQLEDFLAVVQDVYYRSLGTILPKVGVQIDESLEGNALRFQLNDLRLPSLRGLEQDQFMVYSGTADLLADTGVVGERIINPFTNHECAIVRGATDAAKVGDETGLATWKPAYLVLQGISNEILKNVGAFLNTDAVKWNMKRLQQSLPTLVDTVFSRFDVVRLTQILRNLLEEEISIRDLASILEALLAINGTMSSYSSSYMIFAPPTTNFCLVPKGKEAEDVDAVHYANYLRLVFNRSILYKYTSGDDVLLAYRVDPQVETRLRSVDKQPLRDEEYNLLMQAIFSETQRLERTGKYVVLLTEYDIRKSLRNLIEKEFPQLPVMSYQEVQPFTNLRLLGQISWNSGNLVHDVSMHLSE